MRKILIFLMIIFFISDLKADSWEGPEKKNYTSENGEYILTVSPTEIPEKYSSWLKAKPKKKMKFSAADTTIVHCNATLRRVIDNDTIEIWNKKLINRIAPMSVIVANDGESIVTFDNWASMGYGVDVMVCYDKNGNLTHRFSLENISPFPINDYLFTISSIWWCCDVRYISNNKIEICFEDENKNIQKRIYKIKENEFEN